jgi:hypothetical protein
MEIEKRVTQWAGTACVVLDATRTVLVAVRRLVITAAALVTALAFLAAVIASLGSWSAPAVEGNERAHIGSGESNGVLGRGGVVGLVDVGAEADQPDPAAVAQGCVINPPCPPGSSTSWARQMCAAASSRA